MSVRVTSFRCALTSAALTLLASSQLADAQALSSPGVATSAPTASGQIPDAQTTLPGPANSGDATAKVPPSGSSAGSGAALAGFQFTATALLDESYINNATGIGERSQQDYLTSLGLSLGIHEHGPRLALDASYSGVVDFYDNGTYPTQFINNLQALGNFSVIPEHFDIDLRAFAQPVVTSNFGALNSGNAPIPGSFSSSYGYDETPDLKFNLGDFATLKTMPSIGQVFFIAPPGTSSANTLAGIPGPENTTLRSVTEEISSGSDFEVLNWNVIGVFRETDDAESLLSEKSGIANASYALNHEWSLLATGGYDALSDTIPLRHNVSGPVALAGFALTVGRDFKFQGEAGERYNSFSFNGNLRYDVGPTTLLTGSASDFVMTPEEQLLSNLGGLTASPGGTLTSANGVYENGTASTLTPFSVQSAGNPLLSQFVARYQTVGASLSETLTRTSASISMFGTRMAILTSGLPGPPIVQTWGSQLSASHRLNPLFQATLGVTYTNSDEFGGQASIITTQGALDYSLSRETHVILQLNYVDRLSSKSLVAFSPLAGSANEYMATLGLSHTL